MEIEFYTDADGYYCIAVWKGDEVIEKHVIADRESAEALFEQCGKTYTDAVKIRSLSVE